MTYRVGTLVTVTARQPRDGKVVTYTGTVIPDRYPDSNLQIEHERYGVLRFPFKHIISVKGHTS